MSLGDERELVPLGVGFDIAKRGYSRGQVDEHLERLDADLKMLTSDRDAAISQAGDLARQLEVSRNEIGELRGQVERLSLPPTSLEGLSERLQRMLRLAQDEATETKARAEAEAVHIRAKAEADASAMRTRYDQLLADLDARRQEMEAEHRKVMERARSEADSIINKAKQERLRLDLDAEERRTKVEEDFEIAMATRRTESMRALAEQEASSKAEAERRLREATEEAQRVRAQIAKERSDSKAEAEARHRNSVEDANRRKQESITEANARVAEATEEANRRVREATELANNRINHAADRVGMLRELRTNIANQITSARSVLAEADVLLGAAGLAALAHRDPLHQADGSAEEAEEPPTIRAAKVTDVDRDDADASAQDEHAASNGSR
ncbi:MAG: chromosome segregation protein [Haloechinothrix sp.]